jgi:hypothetical protein
MMRSLAMAEAKRNARTLFQCAAAPRNKHGTRHRAAPAGRTKHNAPENRRRAGRAKIFAASCVAERQQQGRNRSIVPIVSLLALCLSLKKM